MAGTSTVAAHDVGDGLDEEGAGAGEAAGQDHALDRHPARDGRVEDGAGAVGERLGERAVDGGGGGGEGEAGEEAARGPRRRAGRGCRRTSRARGGRRSPAGPRRRAAACRAKFSPGSGLSGKLRTNQPSMSPKAAWPASAHQSPGRAAPKAAPSRPGGRGRGAAARKRKAAEVPRAPTKSPGRVAPTAGRTTCESMTATATRAAPAMPVRRRQSGVSSPAAVPGGKGLGEAGGRDRRTPRGSRWRGGTAP